MLNFDLTFYNLKMKKRKEEYEKEKGKILKEKV